MDTKTFAEGLEAEGWEVTECVPTIGVSGEILNLGVKSQNIEGFSPRNKTPLGAAATKDNDGAGFIPGKAQRTWNFLPANNNEAESMNSSLGTEVIFFDLEPPSHQGREDFPSQQENINVGDLKSNTQDKANSTTVPGNRGGRRC